VQFREEILKERLHVMLLQQILKGEQEILLLLLLLLLSKNMKALLLQS